jgi:hypothetical protein
MSKRRTATSARSDWIVFHAGVASPEVYKSLGLSHSTNIVMNFNRKAVRDANGVHKAKSLDGMSGGAILRLPLLEQRGNLSPARLVGIVVEEDARQHALVGIRIERILGAINRTPAL